MTRTTHVRRGKVSMIAALAIAASSCSAPQSQQQPPASVAEAPAQSQPGESAAPVAAPGAASQPAPAPAAPVQAAAAAAATPAAVPAPPPAPPKPRVARLRAGQEVTVRTTRALSTKTSDSGDLFSAILEDPITIDGWVVAPAGARVDGRVVEADKGGRLKGKAGLSIELTSLTLADSRKIDIVTSPISSEAAANKGKDAKRVGIGGGAGAAVGAIAGGGKGAAVGALLGAGAGAAMRGDAAEIPAETVVTFELRSPVTIQEKK
jgi:hypothetical protein